jgi:hypothetical protein
METEIVSIPWTDDIDDKVAVACDGDLEIIKRQVKSGIAQLWRCRSVKHFGYVVTRIDPGPELVMVVGEGSGFMEFAPEFVKVARRSGAKIRTHVTRKGMIRLWSRLGVELDEYILRG